MKATQYRPLESNEKALLSFLYAKHGRKTKTLINDAWISGDYSELGIDSHGNDASTLQYIRNSLGPSWLHFLKWKSL